MRELTQETIDALNALADFLDNGDEAVGVRKAVELLKDFNPYDWVRMSLKEKVNLINQYI